LHSAVNKDLILHDGLKPLSASHFSVLTKNKNKK